MTCGCHRPTMEMHLHRSIHLWRFRGILLGLPQTLIWRRCVGYSRIIIQRTYHSNALPEYSAGTLPGDKWKHEQLVVGVPNLWRQKRQQKASTPLRLDLRDWSNNGSMAYAAMTSCPSSIKQWDVWEIFRHRDTWKLLETAIRLVSG